MANYYKRWESEFAYGKMKRGEGTGALSRILSGLSLFIAAYLWVVVFKAQMYIPLGILVVSAFTPVTFFVSLGVLIYFIVVKFWHGVILISLHLITTFIATRIGLWNIKKSFRAGRAKVDALEGQGIMVPLYYFLLAIFISALLLPGSASIICWILFGLALLYEISFICHRTLVPWKRIHYPLMVRYSGIAGYYGGLAQNSGEEFDFYGALKDLVESVYPNLGEDEITSIINTAGRKRQNFDDRKDLEEILVKRNPNIDRNEMNNIFEGIKTELIDPEHKGYIVRYLISEIIGKEYGAQERLKYILALMRGEVK